MSGTTETVDLAIVIPWRDPGDGERRANFEYVRDYYESLDIGPVIVVDDGREQGQQFNRSAAYNRGYAASEPANVILWNEADTLLSIEAVLTAAHLALTQPGLVVPFTERHELDASSTQAVLDGDDPFAMRGAIVYPDGCSIGQAGVTSVHTMTAIGGRWDEGFEGWGYDDNAMFHVFATLAGQPRWVKGKGVHLWHTPVYRAHTPASQAATDRNRDRYHRMRSLPADALAEYLAQPTPATAPA